MELCTGGELFDRIIEKGHFYEADAVKIIKTVADVASYLHEQNIIHRDIKPENLIFKDKTEESELMIADFGLSKLLQTEKDTKTTCGTPGYMAPEILLKKSYGKAVDMWSIGVMAYFLLVGNLPFEGKSNLEENERILRCDFNFEGPNWQSVSQNAKDFISSLLVLDPIGRATASQALNHPWIASQPNKGTDLLPGIRSGFNGQKVFRKAVDVITAVNKLSNPNLKANHKSQPMSQSNSTDSIAQGNITRYDQVEVDKGL